MRPLLIISFFLTLLSAQDSRLRLKQADLLENKTIDGQAMQILTGNVEFAKGKMTITCALAHYKEKTGQGILTGGVTMEKEGQNLTADSVHYDSPNDIFTCYNQVHIWDEDYELKADTVIYYSEIDSGIATGNTRLDQQNQIVTADVLRYVKHDSDDGVSYTAEQDVRIEEGSRVATCGYAFYDVTHDKTLLKLNPKLEEENKILEGSEIYMLYKEDVLDYVFIPGKAHAKSKAEGFREYDVMGEDTAFVKRLPVLFNDDMSGAALKGYLRDGKMDSLRLEGMATVLYHIFEDSIYQGNNVATGDTIIMSFEETDSIEVEMKNIHVSGGSRGVFTPDSSGSDMDGPIIYTSDKILYKLKNEDTDLSGNAKIKYTDVDLESGFINVNWNNNLLKAIPADPADTSVQAIKPTINEKGRDPMTGDTLVYNLNTKRGRIKHGRTQADDGFYTGDEIRNTGNNVYYIENSVYTTCDLEEPHFHFESRNMKILNKDKVIVRPIVLFVSRIPIFGLPLGIFPHKSGGRHSGWIMPGYGENRIRGQYIDGLGYFWAPNDYWGSKFTMSFGDKQGFVFRLNNHYKYRYHYTGHFNLASNQYLSGTSNIGDIAGNRKSSYKINWQHTHTLRHNQSLNVNVNYSSNSEFNRRISTDPLQRMNQQAISKANYAKRWPSIQASMSLNLSSTTNLMADDQIDSNTVFYTNPVRDKMQTNITTATLPSMNFNLGQRNLIPEKGGDSRWYNNIVWNYNSSLKNQRRNYYETEDYELNDTTFFRWNNEAETFSDNIMTHSMSINAPTKIFRYITFNPSLNMKSDWVNRTFSGTFVDSTNRIIKTEIPGFSTRTTGGFSASLNTQVYGLFPFNIGNLIAIRHVASPSVSYSFRPDFSQPLFGQDLRYFDTFTDTSGQTIYHDIFAGSLAGGTSRSESQSMNFSLNNNFQAKINHGEKDKVINLFSWNMRSGYNFVADEFGLKNLSSSIRSKVGKLSLDLSLTHDFYDYDISTKKRLNSIKRNKDGIPTPRLTNMRFSTGFNLSGKRFGAEVETDTTSENGADSLDLASEQQQTTGKTKKGKLWSTRFSLGLSSNRSNPKNPVESFWMNTSTSLQITKKWRVGYTARFDLLEKDLINHSFTIYRDLHCWEMAIDWTPSGYASGFYLRINVKSPTLKDIKIEERGGYRLGTPF